MHEIEQTVRGHKLVINMVFDLEVMGRRVKTPFTFKNRIGDELHGMIEGGQQAYVHLMHGTLTLK